VGFIIGQPKKAAKSWLILDMCWSLSEGKPVWGVKRSQEVDAGYLFVPPKPLRCVYFSQEDTEDDAHDRIIAHLGLNRQVNDGFWVVPKNLKVCFDELSGQAEMQRELDEVAKMDSTGKCERPIDLVCFDPMRRLHHGDENDSRTIGKMWEVLDRIHRRYGCASLFSHHTVKPPRDGSFYDATDPFVARGSGDIFGGGDAFMTVVPKTRTPDYQTVSMFFESKRGRPLNPAMLKVNLPEEDGQFKVGVRQAVEWLGLGWEPRKKESE
jgi:RecA-family ATPase